MKTANAVFMQKKTRMQGIGTRGYAGSPVK